MMEPTSIEYRLLGILQAYAPDGRAQQICTDLISQMIQDDCTEKQVQQALAGIIYTGLTTGNWPWNTQYVRSDDVASATRTAPTRPRRSR